MDATTRDNIVESLNKLERFIDPKDTRCNVSPEVREAARLYLDSWVAAPLREIIDHLNNHEYHSYYNFKTGKTRYVR